MKKSFLIAVAACIFTAVAIPNQASAQKYQGQIVPTVGVGYSITGLLLGSLSTTLNALGTKSTKTPVLIGGADFGVSDRFSIGLIYTYQGVSVKYNSYTAGTDTAGNVITVTGDFTDRLTRQSIGLRPLIHFGDIDDLDIYAGARFSYVFWNYNSDRTDVNVDDIFDLFGSPIKPQAIFGMRYFVTENIGLGTEFALGATYFMSIGINARFGGN
jgi:hypothetical protein